jgi:chemotaxis protein histidine kinase CheA
MATDIAGLFTTPEQYQLAQQQAQQAQALQYAQLDPRAQAQYGFYRGGQQLGSAIGGALGGVDPQLQKISQRQQLASQLDQTNPESFLKVAQLAAQSGDPQFAMAIADAGRQMQAGMATARKTTAEAQKAELSLTQEQNLRDELSMLPQNATEQQILGVVTKYGSPDKVLAALQASTDKAAQRELLTSQQSERLAQQEKLAKDKLEAQAEQARKDNEAKMERAKENNASKAELASIAAEGRAQQNAITNSIREQTLQIRQEAANEKKVAAQRQQQGMVSSFDIALDTLDVIANHPGKKAGVGFGGAQLSMIPGTDAAGFAAQLETFKAQTFLPQVQALKGMGALSDAEGKKLTAAVGALSQSMKLEEFNSQIAKIKRDLQAARDRVSAGTNAPVQLAPASTGKTIKFSDLP